MTPFKRVRFPVGLIPWLPLGPIRRRLARAAAERGDPRALRAAADDPAVLSHLGLHRAVLACAYDRDSHLIAHAATGEIGALLAGLSEVRELPPTVRTRVVRAVAPHDPRVALALAPSSERTDRAAIAIAAGLDELAEANLADAAGREAEMLRATLAARAGHWRRARLHVTRAFAEDGLEAPLDADADAPITFGALATHVAPASVDGPLVSVVMPYRNSAATLAMAARSILAQSWRAIELILVDDGSTDEGPGIAADMARADPRLVTVQNHRARGAAGARNAGVMVAKGRFVMLQDSDDWAHPRRVERQVAAASRGAAVSRYFRLDVGGRPVAPQVVPFVRLAPVCLLARREAILAAGPFDEVASGSDSEFLARLDLRLGRSRVRREGSLLMIARWSPASISGDPVSGLTTPSGRAERERYRERWMVRHAGLDLIGEPWVRH